jgi:hypothetical protein
MANINDALKYSKLSSGDTADFTQMIQRFGVVTVMNARVYNTAEFLDAGFSFDSYYKTNDPAQQTYGNAADIAEWFLTNGTQLCFLDTLTSANVNVEGPTKTISGGQYTNPLIKFGKTATLEIQDALGSAKAIQALCGGVIESNNSSPTYGPDNEIGALHYGGDFEGEKTIIGESFFIDQKTGKQVPVTIIFYRFLPNSIFNLTQASDGDATVFDMTGDLLNTEVMVSTTVTNNPVKHGLFYSVLPRITGEAGVSEYSVTNNATGGVITLLDATNVASFAANAIVTEGSGTPTYSYDTSAGTVTIGGLTDGDVASVDVAVFYTDGTMKTFQNIQITATE